LGEYIGFGCTTIFHYLHFKRIASYFKEEAIFIIATPQRTNNRYEKLEQYFVQHQVNYCSANEIISGQVNLKGVVAPYYLPLFNFIPSEVVRIRVLYGYAKDAWNYADWNKGFDFILAYGPYSQRKLEVLAPTVSIGHPRYLGKEGDQFREVYSTDDTLISQWFSSSIDDVLLYCPTWGDLSSFTWFKQVVNQLEQKYRLIIKLHHGISLSNEYDFSELNSERAFLCDETVDLFDLFPYCDVVISDYSGAIFDAMLANKKIVLVNSLPVQVTDTGILNINKMNNVANLHEENVNQRGSLDIQIRDLLPNTDSSAELILLIEDLISKPAIDYSFINTDLYSHLDDQAPRRAYEEINSFLMNSQSLARDDSPVFITFRKEMLINFIELNKNFTFVVWGAGDYGQLVISYLVNNNYSVGLILDSSSNKQGGLLYGIPIVFPDQYMLKNDERLIISFKANDIVTQFRRLSNTELTKEQYIVPFN
jgi:hypothetical protein